MIVETQTTARKIGEYLLIKRNEKRLSTRELGAISGICYSNISRIENGINTNFEFNTLMALVIALDINLTDLFHTTQN